LGGPKGEISIRIVRPKDNAELLPVVMYFHGGGWVLNDKESFDRLLREIANGAGAAVVFVEYSRSPEARYPIAIEEAYAATKWIAENGRSIRVDPSRLAVVGDSPGGNMAAAVTLLARERGGPIIDFQILFSPTMDSNFDTPSYKEFATGYFLTREAMKWFWNHYAPDVAVREQATAAPLKASVEQLKGLPSALVITGEFDPLRDEGEVRRRAGLYGGAPGCSPDRKHSSGVRFSHLLECGSYPFPCKGRGGGKRRIRFHCVRSFRTAFRRERVRNQRCCRGDEISPSILVEGEVGFIGSGSEIHERVPEASKILTTPEDARRFVKATGVDVLAPAVGNMHWVLPSMIRGETQKRLNIGRIEEIKKATNVFMTLQGGSGTNDDDLRQAINAGITIIQINTEIRLAWRQGIETALAKQLGEITPYKLLPAALEAMKDVIRARLKLFSNGGKRKE
jgi:hypothetical protein